MGFLRGDSCLREKKQQKKQTNKHKENSVKPKLAEEAYSYHCIILALVIMSNTNSHSKESVNLKFKKNVPFKNYEKRKESKEINKKCASAGNRTRIDCLEGNHANLYTTDALVKIVICPILFMI